LQPVNDRPIGPRRLGQEALQAARRCALDGLGQILGITAVGLLDQQTSQVLLAALTRFRAPKQGRKFLMKLGERCRHLFELDLVDVLPSTAAQPRNRRTLYHLHPSL
jgi:hypothetical protein